MNRRDLDRPRPTRAGASVLGPRCGTWNRTGLPGCSNLGTPGDLRRSRLGFVLWNGSSHPTSTEPWQSVRSAAASNPERCGIKLLHRPIPLARRAVSVVLKWPPPMLLPNRRTPTEEPSEMSFTIEEESGTFSWQPRAHNGYWAGDFHTPTSSADLARWFTWGQSQANDSATPHPEPLGRPRRPNQRCWRPHQEQARLAIPGASCSASKTRVPSPSLPPVPRPRPWSQPRRRPPPHQSNRSDR